MIDIDQRIEDPPKINLSHPLFDVAISKLSMYQK